MLFHKKEQTKEERKEAAPILEVQDLHYAYNDEKHALNGVSLQIREGEKIAVLGANGAGKSTFFLSINGVLRPHRGEIFYRGELITKKKLNHLRKNVGIVFQDADNQIIASTVMGEVSFGPMNLKLPREEVLRRVDKALSYMNITEFRDRPPHYLSGGEKKRVSIADILAMEPELMLLDEPASSLDPVNQSLLEENLEKLHQKGIALVVATHDVDFAWRWAKRILIFHQGRLVADGRGEEIFADEALIEKSGLKKPLLYEVGKIYGISPLPKTLKELLPDGEGISSGSAEILPAPSDGR